MGILLQDLRFALRTLGRTPAFPLAAVGTLAIGIAATTAIFSTVNAALLKPLPYPNPGDLYSLRTALTDGRVTTGNLSPVEIIRLNDPSLSIVRAAGLQGNDVTLLQNDGTPVKTRAYAISEGFFEVFGLPMTLGGSADATREQRSANGHRVVPHLARHVRLAIPQSSARRSALRRSRRRWRAWRHVISIRRPVPISGFRFRWIPEASITVSRASCGSSRAPPSSALGARWRA